MLEAQVAGNHDFSDFTPDDLELLDEMLVLQQADTLDKVSKQFTEIKDILAALTVT